MFLVGFYLIHRFDFLDSVIVLVGIAIGVYSVCKGCQGMQEHAAQTAQQDRMTVHSLVAPYAGLVQQRPEDANQVSAMNCSEDSNR